MEPEENERRFVHEYGVYPPNAILPDQTNVASSSRQWIPSPQSSTFLLPPAPPNQQRSPPIIPDTQPWEGFPLVSPRDAIRKMTREDLLRRKSTTSRLNPRYWVDLIKSKKRAGRPIRESWLNGDQRQATIAEWRAEGYWSRPTIDGVRVHNATPPGTPRAQPRTMAEIHYMMSNLNDEDGTQHPERWIPRIEHPSLPPRPMLWRDLAPPREDPWTLPPNIQLNPMLVHREFGKPPILFDMRISNASWILIGDSPPLPDDPTPGSISLEMDGPNGAQPATHPGVSALPITGLADDPMAMFAWPFIVMPHHSWYVTVKDVLVAIMKNFDARMFKSEVSSLSRQRVQQVFRAYNNRLVDMAHEDEDGIRRIDYLGDRHYFRGLESGSDGAMMLFTGPPP